MIRKLKPIFLFLIVFHSNPIQAQDQNGSLPIFEHLKQFTKVRDFSISKSGDEAYFTIQSPLEEISVIAVIRKVNNRWEKPEIAPFSGFYKDLEPFLSPDNKRLYFVSNRPSHPDSTKTKDYDIWYVERKNVQTAWGIPKNLGKPINTSGDEFYPSVAKNGNLYFTSVRPEGKGEDDIYFSKWNGKSYKEPISLNETINTKGYEFNAYVAPDESYLIFSGYNREDGLGSGDMYISLKKNQGNWTKARNLGVDVNSKYMDYCPFVDEKSKTLYFTSRKSSIKPFEIKRLDDLKNELIKYENGQSRIYSARIAHLFSNN